jgi:hypothetical protein
MEGDVVKGKEARVEKQLVLRVQEQGRRVILGVASSIELELFVIVPAEREGVDVRQLLLDLDVREEGVQTGTAVLEELLQVALVAGSDLLVLVESVLELDVAAAAATKSVDESRGTHHPSSILSRDGRPFFLVRD